MSLKQKENFADLNIISNNWAKFDTPLIRRTDIDWVNLKSKEYGMKIIKQKELKTKEWKDFMEKENKRLGA